MIVALVSALSASVVAGLAAAGYPPLQANVDGSPGGILLGREHVAENWSPPRIIFVPTGSAFAPRDTSRGTATRAANQPYSAESLRLIAERSFATELLSFEVRCWGIAPVSTPLDDFEYTQALYRQVLASCEEITAGCYTIDPGEWTDTTLVSRAGREFVFGLTFATPVTNTLAPLSGTVGLPFAPSGVAPQITDTIISPDGTSGAGCEDPT